MYDGSIYQFDALITRNRQEFNEAVDFLQAQGVQIHDSLKILDYLKTGSYLSYYLEKLEAVSYTHLDVYKRQFQTYGSHEYSSI